MELIPFARAFMGGQVPRDSGSFPPGISWEGITRIVTYSLFFARLYLSWAGLILQYKN